MNDLKDLADYVVNNPDAYEYRWRLAKKLYMAWEYNESLRHLQILKKKWNRKLNVLRYLAATYYRLGRYDEAVTELEQILAQWPSEIPVWEQLAKVHEVAGHAEQAATAWEGVLRLDPDHSIASRSIQRLRSTPANTPQDELHLADSDSGINLRSGRICDNCGAQNSEEFDRCWQCHASLAHPHTPLSVNPLPEPTTSGATWARPLVGGLLSVMAFSGAVYIGLRYLPVESASDTVPASVYAALAEVFYWPRLAIGGALLLFCPIVLWGLFRIFRISGMSFADACGAGLLVASVSYLLLWLPVPYQRYALAGPLAASLTVVLLFVQGDRLGRLTGVCAINSVLATLVGVAVWLTLVGMEPTRQWPAIEKFSTSSTSQEHASALPPGTAPFQYSLIWATTGSAWLDSLCGKATIEIAADRPDAPLRVQLLSGEKVVKVVEQAPYDIVADVIPGARYTVRVDAPENETIHGTVRGLLPVSKAS